MSTTRTLITAIVLALVTPTAIPNAQPSAIAGGSPGSSSLDAPAPSRDRTREAPSSDGSSDSASLETAPKLRIERNGTVIYADTEEQLAIAIDGLERYERNGLELPPVTITIRATGECPKHDGSGDIAGSLAGSIGDLRIKVCGGVKILLHELGHAWDKLNLSDGDKGAFLAQRGLIDWNHDTWHLAGGEHAADILAWGLDTTLSLPTRIPNHSLCEAKQAYETLTGTEAPVLANTGALARHCTETESPGGTYLPTTDLADGSDLG